MIARIRVAVLALALLAAPAAAAEKVVRIGALYPLSGNAASAGRDAKAGLELALEIVNGRHDLDLPLARTQGLPRLGGARLAYVIVDHPPREGTSSLPPSAPSIRSIPSS